MTSVSPIAEYRKRHELNQSDVAALARQDSIVANGRFAVFIACLTVAWAAYAGDAVSWWWLGLPLAAFVTLMVWHQRVISAMARARALTKYYRRGIERLEGNWIGRGVSGSEFLPADHPYASDLDVLGRGSLFELICTARTRIGQHTLASWFLDAADPNTIRGRQQALVELRDRLALREDLALLGAVVDENVHPHALRNWASEAPAFHSSYALIAAGVAAVAALAALASWPIAGVWPVLLVFAANMVLLGVWRKPIAEVARAVEEPRRELAVLAQVVARLERESWESPMLRSLSATLTARGESASTRLAQLDRLVYFMELPHNQLFAPVAIATLWPVHVAYAIERWRKSAGRHVTVWLDAVGTFEALLSLAAYAFEHPDDPFPSLCEGPAQFAAHALGHPILPEETCVRNDLRLDESLQLVIVSGSNMSGKSTLLRTAGINAVLAQAGAPVRARELALSPLRLGATLHVQDSIQTGASRFYAEIARLKQVADMADRGPTLFLFDEILSGTNSHDRRVGAAAILEALVARGAIGMITTHDLALTQLTDRFGARAANAHFTDQWRDGQLVFPYRLQPGVVRQGNALRLMKSLGLPVEDESKATRPGPQPGP